MAGRDYFPDGDKCIKYPGMGAGVLYKVSYGVSPPQGPTPYPFVYHS